MMVYEQKPSRGQCIDVAKDLVRKYPQIADPIGEPHVSMVTMFDLFKLLHNDCAYCRDLGPRRLFSK